MSIRIATAAATAALAAVVLPGAAGLSPVSPAAAGVVSHGPVLAFGASEVKDFSFFIPSFGWRLELEPCRRLGGWLRGNGTELTFPIEVLVGIVTDDDDTAEATLLPLARFEPAAWQDRSWLPFLELGIGFMYTGLQDIGLGDQFLFSNNVGAGISLKLPHPFPFHRTSIGYRFRHASHAGLLGEKNVGSNTHYLTVTFE